MYQEITTVELAFKALNLDTKAVPDVSLLLEKDQKPIMDHYLMVKVIEAINEGWVADLGDDDQAKYCLWPDIVEDESKPSGFGFSYDVWTDSYSDARVGSRLCFQSRAKARHFFDYFQDLLESYMITIKG